MYLFYLLLQCQTIHSIQGPDLSMPPSRPGQQHMWSIIQLILCSSSFFCPENMFSSSTSSLPPQHTSSNLSSGPVDTCADSPHNENNCGKYRYKYSSFNYEIHQNQKHIRLSLWRLKVNQSTFIFIAAIHNKSHLVTLSKLSRSMIHL